MCVHTQTAIAALGRRRRDIVMQTRRKGKLDGSRVKIIVKTGRRAEKLAPGLKGGEEEGNH